MLKLKLQYFGHLIRRADLLEKSLMLGKIKGRRRERESEMAGWHHQCNGHELGQTLGDDERQGSLACCSSWGCKESDMTEKLNNNRVRYNRYSPLAILTTHFLREAFIENSRPYH